MAKQTERLNDLKVRNAKPRQTSAGLKSAMYPDGDGLYLQVSSAGTKSWIFRYRINKHVSVQGRPLSREMGLGSFKAFGLAEARERARRQRQLLADGLDPLEVSKAARARDALEAAKAVTFREAATKCMAARRPEWRNAKHAAQWETSLASYVYPVVGTLSVQSIDTELVLAVLEPIWTAKPETASRVRGRIETILDWAKVRGYRAGENPARWRGHLDQLLSSHRKVAKAEGRKLVRHLPALPYAEIGNFMAALRERSSVEARALEFLILTAARSNEVLGSRWDEITEVRNVDEKTKRVENIPAWVVPAARMKGGRDHRVPLPARALEILETLSRDGEHVFPGFQSGKPLHSQALRTLANGIRSDITVHGFRSTFKDWASEQTAYPGELSEMALAHAIIDKTEAAYRRGDMIEKRRTMMEAWARYCAGEANDTDNVVPIRGAHMSTG
jgi:integrase